MVTRLMSTAMRAARLILLALAIAFGGAGLGTANGAVPIPRLKPAAPVSPWITPSDEAALKAVLEAIDKHQYSLARTLRDQVKEPIARSVADWAYYRSDAKDFTTGEVANFLDKHFGWPNDDLIQAKVERTFSGNTPVEEIELFFDQRDPITGEGHLHLARAFFERGQRDAGLAQLRKAWIDHNWSSREERDILTDYGSYLTEDDHWAKADRQLFEINATVTRRLLPYLSSDRRRQAEARIALLRQDANAPTLYNSLALPSARDSGVLHAVTRYYRRRDQEEKAILYAGLAPLDGETLRNPERWFTERKLLARWALKNGRFEDAYTLSAYSGLEDGADFAEAEFMAGWIALRFLGDPERAKAHFSFLSTGVTSPISLSRGEYWLARAWEAAGDRDAATQHYQVAAAYPYAYYGQLAIEKLGPAAEDAFFPEPLEADAESLTIFEARPIVHAMRILAEVDEHWHFDRFARALDDQIESTGEVVAYYDLALSEWKTYLAVRAAKVARNNGVEVPSVIYPMYPVPDAAKMYAEEPLILGLSRQESEFNPSAYSRARARGMMQLLASTAQLTARKEGLPYSTSRLMSDPSYNFTIGAAHLSHLLERFNGSYIMVLASYNAGPHRVDRWIEEYGDPRDPNVDPLDWIELIPFSETRNYVMRVLENTQVYRSRIDGIPLGQQLAEDIVRGGNNIAAFGISPPAPRLLDVSYTPEKVAALLETPDISPLAVRHFEALQYPPITTITIGGGGQH